MSTDNRFSLESIQDILFLSKNATAIYTGASTVIEFANQAMLDFWGKDKSVIGLPLEEAVPELKGQPFGAMLREAWETGSTIVHKNMPAELRVDDKLQLFYFDFEYRAILDEKGKTYCILHTAIEVSERMMAEKLVEEKSIREQELTHDLIAINEEYQATNEELSALNEEYQATNEELNRLNDYINSANKDLSDSNEALTSTKADLVTENQQLGDSNVGLRGENVRLITNEKKAISLLNDAPVAIALLSGKEMILETANARMLDLVGKEKSIIGKPLAIAIPELKNQKIPDLLQEIFIAGKTSHINQVKLLFEQDGKLVKGFYDLVCHPLKNEGEIDTMMMVLHDITDQVKAKTIVEESERKIRTLVEQAAVAIIVFRGNDFVIDAVNPKMLRLLDKPADIAGKPLLEAVPELLGQPAYELLHEVYTTGKTFKGSDTPVRLERNGNIETGYYNFTYTPLIEDGKITGIIDTAVDVTDQVMAAKLVQQLNDELAAANEELSLTNRQVVVTNQMLTNINEDLILSRKQLEQSESILRLAVDAANFGNWSIDVDTRTLIASSRFKELFGFHPEDKITLDDCINQITDDFRPMVEQAMENAIANSEEYDLSYTIKTFNDQKIRWVRTVGNLTDGINTENKSLTGIIMDITEQKRDEQRKNDFIGMVSHELKTPLTSLAAYIQLLQKINSGNTENHTTNALEKAGQQVKKMNTMINGFLNLSRLESGKIHLEKNGFELNVLIGEIISDLQMTSSSYHIKLSTTEDVVVKADRDKIGNVITNLISNAIKYSPNNKDIEVFCKVEDGNALVLVTDKGMGIKPENLPNLFDRFYRVESKQNSTISGFGIGLYLSAEIIQRHGGKIWADSVVGAGTTVGFSLPL
ncbi:PAS domain-containing protein [Pedobacter aquatilis]|uniref:PAS domain-containing protein n=1 Tax=Pedobacter aquatilis TaxID=351343 RepID=UPI002931A67E|nr:PAS domain-containing protein [Pedobacter aquatilis]